MSPTKIKIRDNEYLDITWDDGKTRSIKLSNLRNNCPCAVCLAEKDEWSSSYIPLYTLEQLKITKIEIIGNYALGIKWEDGHDTGLYDYNYLLKLFDQYSKS
jgi:DUF971 family protein